MLSLLALASALAATPYSYADGYAVCARHQYTGIIEDEGSRTTGVGWDKGFAYCHDFMQWWAAAQPRCGAACQLEKADELRRQDARDKRVIDEIERALGAYPQEQHVR